MKELESFYNFQSVLDGKLYRSKQPDRDFLLYLKEKYRIKTIVNLRRNLENFEKEFARTYNVNLLHIPLRTFLRNPKEKNIYNFLKLFDDSQLYPVLLHCREGKDRTGVMVALFRLLYQNWPIKKVLAEMESQKTKIYWQIFMKLRGKKLLKSKKSVFKKNGF